MVKFITKTELFGLNERGIEETRSKEKKQKEVKKLVCIHWNSGFCKINVTKFVLMSTMIFICRGGISCITNVETYRDRQGQKRTDRDRHGQTRKSRDRQGRTGTSRDRKGLSLFVPALSLPCPCLSLPSPWH